MCGTDLCDAMPAITTTVVVSFCYERMDWHAHVCSHAQLDDSGPVDHGGLHRTFGPFDETGDVLQWVYREAAALIRNMPGQLDVDVTRFLSKGTTQAGSNEPACDVGGESPHGPTGIVSRPQSGKRSE